MSFKFEFDFGGFNGEVEVGDSNGDGSTDATVSLEAFGITLLDDEVYELGDDIVGALQDKAIEAFNDVKDAFDGDEDDEDDADEDEED